MSEYKTADWVKLCKDAEAEIDRLRTELDEIKKRKVMPDAEFRAAILEEAAKMLQASALKCLEKAERSDGSDPFHRAGVELDANANMLFAKATEVRSE